MSFDVLSSRAGRLQPTAVNAVLREVAALLAEGRAVVSLMRGQPDFATPSHIVTALEQALRKGRTGYPDNRGEPALRRAIADKLKRENGVSYDPDREILVTDGATSGLCAALGVLVGPGTGVLLPDPVYDAYNGPVALWGAQSLPVPAQIRDERFVIDRQALERAWTPQAGVLLLNTPWNPVGTVLSRSELDEIMAFALERELVVISDEIYEAFLYDGVRHISPASLSAKARERTVLVNSLSKSFAMTGWRVGYCAGPADLIQAMFLVLQQWSRGPATFVQDAAACALTSGQKCVAEMCIELQGRRDCVLERLSDVPGVSCLKPEGGLFVMVDVRPFGVTSDAVRRFLLEETGVVVVHGGAYGPGGEGTLRVSFAAGGPVLEEGLNRLRAGLLRLGSEKSLRELA